MTDLVSVAVEKLLLFIFIVENEAVDVEEETTASSRANRRGINPKKMKTEWTDEFKSSSYSGGQDEPTIQGRLKFNDDIFPVPLPPLARQALADRHLELISRYENAPGWPSDGSYIFGKRSGKGVKLFAYDTGFGPATLYGVPQTIPAVGSSDISRHSLYRAHSSTIVFFAYGKAV